jgi:RNA polymerase subunit RPABC4/transcription elongation factor Spt4
MVELLPLAFAIGFVYFMYLLIKQTFFTGGKISAEGQMICTACGTRGVATRHTKGSIFIEIALWLCFLLPGLIYSIWRLTSKQDVCPACGSPAMIPVNTPAGRKLVNID